MAQSGRPNLRQLYETRDVRGLIQALHYEQETGVQAAATMALGRIGGSEAVRGLGAALNDPTIPAKVRRLMARTLGQLGDRHAVAALTAALDDAEVNSVALEVLAQIENRRDMGPLEAAVKREDATTLFKALRDSNPVVSIRASLAMNLRCRSCGQGLELRRYGFGGNSGYYDRGEQMCTLWCDVCPAQWEAGIDYIKNMLPRNLPQTSPDPLSGGSAGRQRAPAARMATPLPV